MFKKSLYFFLLVILSQLSLIEAKINPNREKKEVFFHCSPKLKEVVALIRQLPEANTLFSTIQQEGSFSILIGKNNSVCEQFGACWDPDRRIIFVKDPSVQSQGELIGSILFELQNALVNTQINYYNQLVRSKKIGLQAYIKAIELLEYRNSLNASKLTKQGIQAGLFPSNTYLETYPTFEEHYQMQKMMGHTTCIENNYHQLIQESIFN